MKIAYHIGAHSADGDNLLRGLLKDKERLLKSRIAVPGPGKYRRNLREVLAYADGGNLNKSQGQEILNTILDNDTPDRLVLSAPNFMGFPKFAVKGGVLYPDAPARLATLTGLLPATEVELHLSISNPATLLPALLEQCKGASESRVILQTDPRLLHWSDLIERLRQACPNAQLVVWCQEDTPLIWSEVLFSVAGLAANEQPLEAANDVLAEIMTKEGLQRYQAYMKARSPMTQQQHSAVAAAFLDKFSVPGSLEQEIDMPGWDMALIEEATRNYEEDTQRIMAMPDVDMILP